MSTVTENPGAESQAANNSSAGSQSLELNVGAPPSQPSQQGQQQSMPSKSAQEDDHEEPKLFDDSSHQLFLYFGRNGKKNWSGLIVSLFVISMQTGLYGVCFKSILEEFNDEKLIPVQVTYGRRCTVPDNLVCPPDLVEWYHAGLAVVLMAFFLMHDMVATIKIFLTEESWISKLAAVVIFLEAVLAAVVGSLFALQASSAYDALVNCIGVLFIHDVDENAYNAFKVLNVTKKCKTKCKCCSFFGKTELTALFIITFSLFCLAWTFGLNLKKEDEFKIESWYGKDYAENRFGDDGYYDYDYADNYNLAYFYQKFGYGENYHYDPDAYGDSSWYEASLKDKDFWNFDTAYYGY